MKIQRTLSFVVACVLSGGLMETAWAEPFWSSWRGPTADGHSQDENLPVAWSAADVDWKVPLDGEGQSSPCVWGDRIFLTSSLKRGAERLVYCLSRSNGKRLWEHTAWTGQPEPTHKMNGWASASCTTDGELVYAFFGKGGLHCYTVNGELQWSNKELGDFEGPWGTAATPVLYQDLVIQNCDADRNAYLVAFNKKTGKQAWKTKRDDYRGWSTPVLVEADGRTELVLNGHLGVRAYDPATGKELWFCKGHSGRGEPTVTLGENGLLHVVNGKPGPVFAIKPGGNGDVTKERKVWETPRGGGRDLPSPIVLGGQMLVVSMQGVLTAYDSDTGKELWKGRLAGNYSASPIAYNGLAFFLDEAGQTAVVKPGNKLEVIARNQLNPKDDEIFRAVITPSEGQLLIRSDQALYCVGRSRVEGPGSRASGGNSE